MTIIDDLTEARLLAAMLCEADVLEACADLETRDFTEYRHVVVFSAIRTLQAEGADVDVLEVDRVLELRDGQYGRFHREIAGAAFMGRLVLVMPPYQGKSVLYRHDVWWLRELTRRRGLLMEAA